MKQRKKTTVNASDLPPKSPVAVHEFASFRDHVTEHFDKNIAILEQTGGDQTLNPEYAKKVAGRSFKQAAVLFPVLQRPQGPMVLLTQRTEHLSSHSGQIALPGGKLDPGESPQQAALREAHEEVGLLPSQVEVVGTFGTYYSGSGFAISPVIGLVENEPELTINENEVADIFEVPLWFLMNQQHHRRESRMFQDQEIFFYTMPYLDETRSPAIERRIWCVTAGIIRMVQERLFQ